MLKGIQFCGGLLVGRVEMGAGFISKKKGGEKAFIEKHSRLYRMHIFEDHDGGAEPSGRTFVQDSGTVGSVLSG